MGKTQRKLLARILFRSYLQAGVRQKEAGHVRWVGLKLPRQKAFTPRKRGRGACATNQYFQGFGRRQQKTRQSAGLSYTTFHLAIRRFRRRRIRPGRAHCGPSHGGPARSQKGSPWPPPPFCELPPRSGPAVRARNLGWAVAARAAAPPPGPGLPVQLEAASYAAAKPFF